MKPDSATTIPISDDRRVEQPAHEAQARRALARQPGALRGIARGAAPERPVEQRRERERDQHRGARVDPGPDVDATIRSHHGRDTTPAPSCSTRSARCSTFEPPAPHLRAALRERTGATSATPPREAAIRAEIAYYRAHLHEGAEPEALARPAPALRGGDGRCRSRRRVVLEALLASLRFYAYPDSAPTLRALRDAGIRTVVVSNWDWSLHERLAETGLAALVDGAVASAEVGSAKPDGAIFRAALELAGAARRRRGTSATRRRPTSRAPAPPACGRS